MPVQLTPDDLGRLFGKRLYILPSKQAVQDVQANEEPTQPVELAPKAEAKTEAKPDPWRRVQQPRLSLVLDQAEYESAEHKALLGNILDAMSLSETQCDKLFVHQGKLERKLLDGAKTKHTLVLGYFSAQDVHTGRELRGERTYHYVPGLASMLSDKQNKRTTWERLKAFKDEV